MRLLEYVGLTACPLLIGVAAFFIGVRVGVNGQASKSLAETGISAECMRIYTRALKLLNYLAKRSDLDGLYSEDILSTTTEERINALLDDYRKEIHKP